MNKIEILYFTDNKDGESLAARVSQMGVSVTVYDFGDVEKICEGKTGNYVLIFDLIKKKPEYLIKFLSEIKSVQNTIKLIITENKDIEGVFFNAVHLLNLEFIIKPVDERSFLLLLEKTLLVEKYRHLMKFISDESESRIDVLECMLNIKRKDMYDEGTEKEIFIKILDFEKRLMEEHLSLNESIRNIALYRNTEFIALKDRVKAEEMLNELRRAELINANRIIEAQESLIEYSSRELIETKKIINAKDNVEELSRAEAMDLHTELERLKGEKRILESKIDTLMNECSNSGNAAK
ncbi:MAG: hypothetical protein CVV49_15490 [Spirochaetae bacterium HGW-Spirochaetae-5]|nr:MAG: hypothetical protein CVV49_15490 [Spirochaetae bacterium HGW-Spirochaetae-5]